MRFVIFGCAIGGAKPKMKAFVKEIQSILVKYCPPQAKFFEILTFSYEKFSPPFEMCSGSRIARNPEPERNFDPSISGTRNGTGTGQFARNTRNGTFRGTEHPITIPYVYVKYSIFAPPQPNYIIFDPTIGCVWVRGVISSQKLKKYD